MIQSPSDNDVPGSGTVQDKPEFSLIRVIAAAFTLVLAGGLAFGAYWYASNQQIVLVKATGRVMWDGKPVTIGAVMTEYEHDPIQVAIGAFDSEGRFELTTNGAAGAAVGKHRVIVASYGAGMGTTPLVPKEYLKASSTPLTIEVTTDPAKNHFELEVVGEAPKNEQWSGGGGADRGENQEGERPSGEGSDTAPEAVSPQNEVKPATVSPAPGETPKSAPSEMN